MKLLRNYFWFITSVGVGFCVFGVWYSVFSGSTNIASQPSASPFIVHTSVPVPSLAMESKKHDTLLLSRETFVQKQKEESKKRLVSLGVKKEVTNPFPSVISSVAPSSRPTASVLPYSSPSVLTPSPNSQPEEDLLLLAQENTFYPNWTDTTKKVFQEYASLPQPEPEVAEKNIEAYKRSSSITLESLTALNAQIQKDHLESVQNSFPSVSAAHEAITTIAELEPKYVYVPFSSSQWELDYVLPSFSPSSNFLGSGNPVVVAVIDTGIDTAHEDLAPNIWKTTSCVDENGMSIAGGCPFGGWDFVDNDANPFPADGYAHGTQVAGMVAAVSNNSIGVSSVSGTMAEGKVLIMPIRACCTKEGFFESTTIEKAIYFAVQNGAKVINMSFGGPTKSERIRQAIDYANQNGVMVVAAAGNYASNNDTTPIYPANYDLPNMISVGATNALGKVASFSNYGTSVHVLAPGDAVQSTTLANAYATIKGTSFAAPLVAGVLAVYLNR